MFREARVIVQARNLQRAERQDAVLQFVVCPFVETLQLGDLHTLHARHRLRRSDEFAQINAGAERQIVRVEESESAIGQDAIAEDIEQRRLSLEAPGR